MKKEPSPSQNQSLWKDRVWNLLVLLIGVALGFGFNLLHIHIQNKQEMESALTLLREDVAYQVDYSKMLVIGFKNLKSGEFPNIAKKAPTLDRALNNTDTHIGMSLQSHRSPISEHILSKIDLLPKRIATDVLKYYSNIFYCQSLQNECKEVLAKRETKKSEKLAPICDIYLDVLKSCVNLGESLLNKIGNEK